MSSEILQLTVGSRGSSKAEKKIMTLTILSENDCQSVNLLSLYLTANIFESGPMPTP